MGSVLSGITEQPGNVGEYVRGREYGKSEAV